MGEFFSREDVMGGMPARRSGTLLFAIEARTAQYVAESRRAASRFVTERGVADQESAFLEALAQGRDLPLQPTIQDLEHYAPAWASLIPDEPGIRAALAHMISEKYTFTYQNVPRLRQALGLDDPALGAEYERRHNRPIAEMYSVRTSPVEVLRWGWARWATWLEDLPPFWTVFALTLTETVGAGVLAMPIAFAGLGPLAGIFILIVLGLVNIITVVALTESAIRSGSVRYGQAYFGGLVSGFLGKIGGGILTPTILSILGLSFLAYYLGFATTLAGVTGLRAEVWAGLLFLVQVYFLRRSSLDATVAFALMVGAINIVLILVISGLGLAHLDPANLNVRGVPFIGGHPFDPTILGLIFGVIMASYAGHFSTTTCARLVLHRDPSGRSLLWGNVAAMTAVMVLFSLFVLAVNGSVSADILARERGTALLPLAQTVGSAVSVLGVIFVILSLGMASINTALALFNQVGEWLPRTTPQAGKFWWGLAPVVVLLALAEWFLWTGEATFTELFWTMAVSVPILVGIFPMLLVAATRQKGETLPAASARWLGSPGVVWSVYLFFLTGIFLHGVLIWSDPIQRIVAIGGGLAVLLMTFVVLRQGALKARAVVELRVEQENRGMGTFHILVGGKPLAADVHLLYVDHEENIHGAVGELKKFADLRSAFFTLPSLTAHEIKVWAHEVTPEGLSQGISAAVTIDGGGDQPVSLGNAGYALLPLDGNGQEHMVEIKFGA